MASPAFHHAASLLALAAGAALLPAAALAQSTTFTAPNISNNAGESEATLNGTTFTNQGMVGAGRLPANTRDFAGETLGSFSGMALDLANWRRGANGSYTVTMFTLPDRGPNDVGTVVGTVNYRSRVHTSAITFSPYTGTAVLPQATTSQNQVTINPTGGFFLTDTTGALTTGRDPGANTFTRGGITYPSPATGAGAGLISLDAEAIAFLPDGSFYISDEYAAGVYYFDRTGRQIGAIQAPAALLPRTAGAINFNSSAAPTTGRRNNQGLEALSITPDNRRLVTILQSATVQDTAGSAQQTRNNTRVLVYDISGGATPTNPIGHYVLQLPTFNVDGSGAAANRTAAQSEMLALNDTQFLVLARDGIGRGAAPSAASTPIYKSVLLIDTANATNLAGTQYETGTTPVATGGTLATGIVPVQQVELVNLLNAPQLNRFGMNLTTRSSTATTISEKQEAMALAPVLEEGAPQDFFLFIGNDNDFQASNGFVAGETFDASLSGVGGTGVNDSVLLVYRLTLPTYVDPQALAALGNTAPNVLYGTRVALNGLAATATRPAMRFVGSQRGWAGASDARVQLWADAGWNNHGQGATSLSALDAHTQSATMGIDVRLGDMARLGAFGGYRQMEGTLDAYAPISADGYTFGGYGALYLPMGLYAEAAGAVLTDITLDQIARHSAYGQQAVGSSTADGWAGSAEIGWAVPVAGFKFTPFAAADYSDLDLAGYAESGASVSNLTFAARSFERFTYSFGAEVAAELGMFRPSLRGGYAIEEERGDEASSVRLTSAQHTMGTQNLVLGVTERDAAFGEARLAVHQGALTGFVSAGGRWGRGEDEANASIGVAIGF